MPAKRQSIMLPTHEPVSRDWLAGALRHARRNDMRIVREQGWYRVFMTTFSRDPIVFAPAASLLK